MNEVKSFTFYRNYYELLDNLPSEDKRLMLEVIADYMFKNVEPKGLVKMNLAIWNNIKMPLDTSKNNSLRSIGNGAPNGNQNASKKQTENKPENKPKTNRKGNRKQTNNISYFLFLFSNLYISNLNNKDNIYKLLEEYLDIRSKNKYVVNETVIKRLINKLNQYGTTDEEKALVIENAINGKWKDFYPLKESEKEKVPEWFNKELKNEPMTEEDKKEMDKLLKDIQNEIGG